MSRLTDYSDRYIDKSIYVWSGQGENVCVQMVKKSDIMVLDPEKWIKGKESSSSNANRVIDLYRRRIAEGINPVYCFDCSGFIVEMLIEFGLMKAGNDLNTKGLWALCDKKNLKKSELQIGDFCFYSATGEVSDISHIGIYFGDNMICECRGRDYGVVVTNFYDNPANWEHPWNMFGRYSKLKPFTVDEPDEPVLFDVTNPVSVGTEYAVWQDALNLAHYTDDAGNKLVVDGKWGKKSRQALNKMMGLNLGNVDIETTVIIEGIKTITH